MTKIIFQDTFLVSGIMCHTGCGATIENALSDSIKDLKKKNLLPPDATLNIDAEPHTVGIQRLIMIIESNEENYQENSNILAKHFREVPTSFGYEVIDNTGETQPPISNTVNWINISVNIAAMLAIIILYGVFPPSLLLTIGLTTLTFLTTTFTARGYLLNFFRNLRHRDLAGMPTVITSGWLLSLAHTLYHSITMPLATNFSMAFMSFLMPISLITLVNIMDEIKRRVLDKSKTMYLQGMKNLFPQMSEEYTCYNLSKKNHKQVTELMLELKLKHNQPDESVILKDALRNSLYAHSIKQEKPGKIKKSALSEGVIVQVHNGECFPVDGFILNGNTWVDSSIVNGESKQGKSCFDFVPAGAKNLGPEVIFYAVENSYNSSINKLLFIANRARDEKFVSKSKSWFIYIYTALIILGLIASIIAPVAMGVLTFSLVMQNVTGILFAICPCTMGIAHQLPALLSTFQLGRQGITVRDENLIRRTDEIHTIVFDKTGTLTTGDSQVESSEGISDALWQRVYLLEKEASSHPIAKAVCHHYEARAIQPGLIRDVSDILMDSKNRGLSGLVQNRQIHIGNLSYLQESGVQFLREFSEATRNKIAKGYTPVYVAEDNVCTSVILIKHELRKDVLVALSRFRKEGKKILMLTGDTHASAIAFNEINGGIFDLEHIHAEQTPDNKEAVLKTLMSASNQNPGGFWFVGDGLNDAPCARIVSEKGGISCAISSTDNAAFFSDISLNGSFNYLFEHTRLNKFLKKNILQNQWLLAYSAFVFLVFIISFSIAGIAVSPLIPLLIMTFSTIFTLFNAYRVKLAVDNSLGKNATWSGKFLASDWSIGLLVSASSFLILSVLIATLATGGLALPMFTFTAGVAAALSTTCVVMSGVMFALFGLLGVPYLFGSCISQKEKPVETRNSLSENVEASSLPVPVEQASYNNLGWSRHDSLGKLDAVTEPRPSGSVAQAEVTEPRPLGSVHGACY
ncbi:MAG: HAD-IC family P-type ATPase [Legionella sp.]|nr:HAD-IC family P-type ATPase [Legionella sp.]